MSYLEDKGHEDTIQFFRNKISDLENELQGDNEKIEELEEENLELQQKIDELTLENTQLEDLLEANETRVDEVFDKLEECVETIKKNRWAV